MNVSALVDLYDAQEARREAQVALYSPDEGERTAAKATLDGIDATIEGLQLGLFGTYTGAYVRCRDVGHTWNLTGEVLDPEGQIYFRSLTCFRCSTVRKEQIKKDGNLNGRYYRYNKNYLMPPKSGGVYDKPFWRGVSYMVAAKKIS